MSANTFSGAQSAPFKSNPALSGAKVTLPRVMRSEWRKFFSLRSTMILLMIAGGLMLLGSVGVMLLIGGPDNSGLGDMDMLTINNVATGGLQIASLLLACAVIVLVAGEYGSHTAVSTFSAVPRRWPVYLSRMINMGVLAWVFGFVAHLVCGLLVMAVGSASGYAVTFEMGDFLVNAAITGVYMLFMAWLGLGLSTILRSTAGAIMVLVAIYYIIAGVLALIGGFGNADWVIWLTKHLPLLALSALRPMDESMVGAGIESPFPPQGEAWITLAVWVIIPLAFGWWSNQRRAVR